jgi:hypothetical protein
LAHLLTRPQPREGQVSDRAVQEGSSRTAENTEVQASTALRAAVRMEPGLVSACRQAKYTLEVLYTSLQTHLPHNVREMETEAQKCTLFALTSHLPTIYLERKNSRRAIWWTSGKHRKQAEVGILQEGFLEEETAQNAGPFVESNTNTRHDCH